MASRAPYFWMGTPSLATVSLAGEKQVAGQFMNDHQISEHWTDQRALQNGYDCGAIAVAVMLWLFINGMQQDANTWPLSCSARTVCDCEC